MIDVSRTKSRRQAPIVIRHFQVGSNSVLTLGKTKGKKFYTRVFQENLKVGPYQAACSLRQAWAEAH
jgi:hypothetical protein